MTDGAAPTGLSNALADILGSLGLSDSRSRTTVEERLIAALREMGHEVTIAEVRWGCATIEADPVTAKILAFDRDRLVKAAGGEIDDIRIRIVRR